MADPDEVLVPYGANVLRQPGGTLGHGLETSGTYGTRAFQPATRANPTAELTKLAHQHGGLVARPERAQTRTSPNAAASRFNATVDRTPKPVTRSTSTTRSTTGEPAGATAKASRISARALDAVDVPSHKPTRAVPARASVEISPTLGHLAVTIDGETFVNKLIKFAVISSSKVSVAVDTKSVVIALTRKEVQQVSKLRAISVGGGKIVSPLVTVMAAKLAGLPLSLACAILEKETSGGRNEWGHDSPKNGAIFYGGYDQAHNKHYPESPITKAAYDAYRAERGPEIGGSAPHQQGVGPAQLTSAWKQDQANLLGGAWKPLPNMIEGFALLRKTIQRDGLRKSVVAYNGSQAYANTVLANERQWARALGVKSMQDQHVRAPYVDGPQQPAATKKQTSKHPTQPTKPSTSASSSSSTPPGSSPTSPGSSSTSPSGESAAPAVPIEIGSTGVYRVPGTNLKIT